MYQLRRTESIEVEDKLSIINSYYADLNEEDVQQFTTEQLKKLSKVLSTLLNPKLIKDQMKGIHQILTARSLRNLDQFMNEFPKFRVDLKNAIENNAQKTKVYKKFYNTVREIENNESKQFEVLKHVGDNQQISMIGVNNISAFDDIIYYQNDKNQQNQVNKQNKQNFITQDAESVIEYAQQDTAQIYEKESKIQQSVQKKQEEQEQEVKGQKRKNNKRDDESSQGSYISEGKQQSQVDDRQYDYQQYLQKPNIQIEQHKQANIDTQNQLLNKQSCNNESNKQKNKNEQQQDNISKKDKKKKRDWKQDSEQESESNDSYKQYEQEKVGDNDNYLQFQESSHIKQPRMSFSQEQIIMQSKQCLGGDVLVRKQVQKEKQQQRRSVQKIGQIDTQYKQQLQKQQQNQKYQYKQKQLQKQKQHQKQQYKEQEQKQQKQKQQKQKQKQGQVINFNDISSVIEKTDYIYSQQQQQHQQQRTNLTYQQQQLMLLQQQQQAQLLYQQQQLLLWQQQYNVNNNTPYTNNNNNPQYTNNNNNPQYNPNSPQYNRNNPQYQLPINNYPPYNYYQQYPPNYYPQIYPPQPQQQNYPINYTQPQQPINYTQQPFQPNTYPNHHIHQYPQHHGPKRFHHQRQPYQQSNHHWRQGKQFKNKHKHNKRSKDKHKKHSKSHQKHHHNQQYSNNYQNQSQTMNYQQNQSQNNNYQQNQSKNINYQNQSQTLNYQNKSQTLNYQNQSSIMNPPPKNILNTKQQSDDQDMDFQQIQSRATQHHQKNVQNSQILTLKQIQKQKQYRKHSQSSSSSNKNKDRRTYNDPNDKRNNYKKQQQPRKYKDNDRYYR